MQWGGRSGKGGIGVAMRARRGLGRPCTCSCCLAARQGRGGHQRRCHPPRVHMENMSTRWEASCGAQASCGGAATAYTPPCTATASSHCTNDSSVRHMSTTSSGAAASMTAGTEGTGGGAANCSEIAAWVGVVVQGPGGPPTPFDMQLAAESAVTRGIQAGRAPPGDGRACRAVVMRAAAAAHPSAAPHLTASPRWCCGA